MTDAASADTSAYSRRSLLITAGAGAVAAAGLVSATSDAASSTSAPSELTADVAVIGAGLAGLTAARTLQRAGKRVHVIEADDRVGGRVWTVRSGGGEPLNWGATFVGPARSG